MADLIAAIEAVITAIRVRAIEGVIAALEASYTYEIIDVKRWILDDGGKSGNCEVCEENADMGWIPDEATFLDSEGNDIDGPEAHPHCECTLEYGEKRRRVYDD